MKTLLTPMQLIFWPLGLLAVTAVHAQDGGDYEIPRTIDGQPDLQGVWANNTMTPVERPETFGEREYLTDEEMAFLRQRMREIADQDGDALFGSGTFNAAFSGDVTSYDPTTGNYDQSWLVEREVHNRTSQIVDPPNGRYPPRTEDSIALTRERAVRVRNIERFTRIGDTQLLYQFTSDDPGTFAAPYTLELLLEYSPDPIYEYACHEGNYAMENILRGARELERLAAEEP